MLIAAAAALIYLFGGSGSDGLFGVLMSKYAEDAIKNTIMVEERRELALEGLALFQNDINDFNKLFSDDIEEFTKLIKNYKSSSEDFEQSYTTMLKGRQEIFDRTWEDRKQMFTHITAEEWKKIYDIVKAAAKEEL
jgi:hypothetical protein